MGAGVRIIHVKFRDDFDYRIVKMDQTLIAEHRNCGGGKGFGAGADGIQSIGIGRNLAFHILIACMNGFIASVLIISDADGGNLIAGY